MADPTKGTLLSRLQLKWRGTLILLIGVVLGQYLGGVDGSGYYGKYIGSFETFFHNLTGKIYAANDNHLIITNLTYDGGGPRAFFWVGNTPKVSGNRGWVVPYPISAGNNSTVLPPFHNELVELKLPNENWTNVTSYVQVAIPYKRAHYNSVNFGQVIIPTSFELPKSRQIPGFTHESTAGSPKATCGVVVIKDAKTISISRFSFDGSEKPQTYFMVGKGNVQAEKATKVPNEFESVNPMGKYAAKDIELKLPDDLIFQDVDWLSVYDLETNTNFGHLTIPRDLNDIPVLASPPSTTRTPSTKKPALDSSQDCFNNEVRLLRVLTLTTPSIVIPFMMIRAL